MNDRQRFKPKLLVVTTTFPRWRNDTDPPFVYELARRLTGDFDVVVHAPHYSGAWKREEMDGMSIYRFRYFLQRWEKIAGQTAILPFLREKKGYFLILPFFLISQLCSLALLIWRFKPDVIHAHWLIPCGFAAACSNLIGRSIPIVVTCHGADIFGLRSRIPTSIKRWTLKRVNFTTTVSSILKEELYDLVEDQEGIEVIPMGVDSSLFNPDRYSHELTNNLRITGCFLLFVGRLSEKKGVKYLLDAARLLHDRGHNFTLVILGDGELSEQLKAQVVKLEIDNIVRFVGAVPNHAIPEYYASADVFIGPSVLTRGGDAEGFGLTFIEASMSGCFIIGTNTGGIVDIIEDKQTGLLAKPHDSFDLAEKIQWFFDNQERAETISAASRKHRIEIFDWQIISQRYSAVFLRIIDDGKRCRS